MAIYVLVHGAWHGGWCWEKVVPLLQQQGHQVYAPDLPGHGDDKTPLLNITLQSYVNFVCQLLDEINEPIILVGHSFGGVIISQVAENRPKLIQTLIYVAAFLPQNNQSMLMVSQLQPPSRFVKLMTHDITKNAFYFPSHAIKDFAYHLCDDNLIKSIKSRLCIEPLSPTHTPVKISNQNFGSVPRIYIQCTEDKAIHLDTQRKMCEQIPCQVFQLKTDHSPFYSDPEGLVGLISQLQQYA